MKKKKVLITAALPYANGSIHFGHLAGAYLPADCYARYSRLIGNDTLYICGSDEYGVAISLSAELAGRSPEEHAEHFHTLNKSLFEKMEISFDHYSRTTWPRHSEATYEYFHDLLEEGYIEEQESEQLYSEKDDAFLADRYVVGTCPKCRYEKARGDECPKCGSSFEATDLLNPASKITGSPLALKKTNHWYLRLDLFREKLLQWINEKKWKPNVMNFIGGYIDELRPRAITRDTKWGIPLPLEGVSGKVLYVWFEAPIGYISATKEWAEKKGLPDSWKDYWLDKETKLVQFIGKDNIPFHAVIFPAMTMGQKKPYKLVDELVANEFYNLEGKKFSKSEGWYIDLESFLERYSPEELRYTLAANAPETQDSEFTWDDFMMRVNAELCGKFGNFIHRTCTFIYKNIEKKGVKPFTLSSEDQLFLEELRRLTDEIQKGYEECRLRHVTRLIMEMAQKGNGYFDHNAPWKSMKEGDIEKVETCLYCSLECIKLLSLVSAPILPQATKAIWKMLQIEEELSNLSWSEIVSFSVEKCSLQKPEVLFKKLDEKDIEREKEQFQ